MKRRKRVCESCAGLAEENDKLRARVRTLERRLAMVQGLSGAQLLSEDAQRLLALEDENEVAQLSRELRGGRFRV